LSQVAILHFDFYSGTDCKCRTRHWRTRTVEIARQDIAGQFIDGQEKHPTRVEIKM